MADPLAGLGVGADSGSPASALAGLGVGSPQPEQPAVSPAGAPAPVSQQYDLSKAVQDDNGVWLKQGEDFYTIAPDKIGNVARVPGVRFATPEEVQGHKDEKKIASDESGFTAALQYFGTGFIDAITALPVAAAGFNSAIAGYGSEAAGALGLETVQAGLSKAERAYQDFARDAGGEALAKDSAYLLHGGVEGEHEFVQAYQARERAFPIMAGIGRMAGLLVPAIATGFAGGVAVGGAEAAAGAAESSLASRLATTILSPSGVRSVAAGGALSGLSQGLAAPFETMDDTPISREAILASGAMGAIVGGATGGLVGAAGKYAPGVLSKVFGKTSTAETRAAAEAEIKAALPDTIRNMAESPVKAEQELYQSIVERGAKAGKGVQAMSDRIEQAVKAAGPNPEAKAVAAEEAVGRELGRVKSSGKTIAPEEWRSSTLSPDEMVRNRDTLRIGARNEIGEHLTGVIDESEKVMEHLKSFEVKAPLVRKNLADLTEDQAGKAITSSMQRVQQMRGEFEQLFAGGEGAIRPSRSSESIGFSFNEAEESLAKAADAADAYVAMDKLRRGVNARLSSLYSQTRSTLADDAFEGTKLFKFADNTYEQTRQFLADSGTWGKQGELQQKVNQAWADDIASSGRVTKLGAFTSRDVQGRYGQQQARVDPDKIDRYLDGLGKRTLPDRDLQSMIETKINLMKEVGAAYDIPKDTLGSAIKSAEGLRDSVKAAQHLMTESGGMETWLTNILAGRMAKMAGHTVGATIGGAVGGVPGALAGHSVGAALEEFAAHRVPQVIASALKLKDAVGLGVDRLPDVYQKQLARNALAGVPVEARALFEVTRTASRAAQLDAYDKRTEVIAKLATSPDMMTAQSQQHLSRFGSVQTTLPATTQMTAQQQIQRLIQNWPGKQDPQIVKSRVGKTVSDRDLKLSTAMWEATTKPLSAFDDFEHGTLDPDKAKWTWLQYPELQRLFQAAAIDTFNNAPADAPLNSNGLAQLDFFLGFNGRLQPTLDRSFSSRMDAIGKQQSQPAQPPQGIPFQNPAAKPTLTERLMGET